MAVGNVSATITIKGQDQASAAINKAGASAKGLSNSLDAAQKKAQGLTGSMRQMASGDVIGGLRGLSGAMGPGAGLAGSAALAAAGIAGITVALGAAAVKATEWSIEVERMRAQMRFAFGTDGEKRALALADAIGGVAVESVVKLQATLKASGAEGSLTVEQLQKITNAATAMGKTGDEALTAFADSLRSGSTEALKQVGVFINGEVAIKQYALALDRSAETLSAAERSQAVLNATLAALPKVAQAGTDAYTRQDKALSNLSNTWARLKLSISNSTAGPTVSILEFADSMGAAVLAGEKMREFDLARDSVMSAGEAMLDAVPGASGLASALDGLSLEARHAMGLQPPLAAAINATTTAISAQSGKIGGLMTAFDAFSSGADKAVKAQIAFAKAAESAAQQRKKAAQAAASQRAKAEADRKRAVDAEFMAGIELAPEFDDKLIAERLKLKSEEDKALRSNASALEAHRDRVLGLYASIETDPARRALIEQQQIEIQLAKDLMEVKLDQTISDGQRATESAALQVAANQQIRASIDAVTEAQNAQIQAQIATASTAASAVKTLVGVFAGEEVAKRAAAGVDAAIETARAIASFAAFDYVGGAMHTASAIAFGKVALTAPTVPSAGGSGPSQAKPAAESNGGGGGTTVINLHGIMTTKAEVGAAIGKALASAKPTGMVPA